MGDFHTAQRHVIAGFKRMNVVAIAGANIGKRNVVLPQALVSHFNILCPGKLCIVCRSFDDANSNALPFGNGGIIREIRTIDCEGLFMRVKDRRVGKRLWCLRRKKTGAGDSRFYGSVRSRLLERVGDSQCGQNAFIRRKVFNDTLQQVLADERPHAIMDHDMLGRRVLQRTETKTRGFLPGGAAVHNQNIASVFRKGAFIKRMIVRMNHDNDAINQGAVDKDAQSTGKHGFAADPPVLFRPLDTLPGSLSAASCHNDCCNL